MAERSKSGKKVVRSKSTSTSAPSPEPSWSPTPEAKSQATKFRLIAAALWFVAIAGELFGIFWVLRQDDINMVLLIALILIIGALAIGGSFLWKKANRLDPASRSETVKFFVQNQLGAIITIVAFLPLIAMIFLNKDMDGKDKAIAGGIGIAVMIAATLFGIEWDAPSVEQYTAEENEVVQITGKNEVFWTKAGKVFHLCEDASAVNLASKDNTIYSGTVAEAHAAGKSRLTKQVDQEKRQCGFDAAATATPSPSGSSDSSGG